MRKEENIYCTDSGWQTAKLKQTKKGWKIMVLPKLTDNDELEYKRVLFNTLFDDLILFNSMSGISYTAVKKNDLWGLIRFRQDKDIYRETVGFEPFDEEAMDQQGREMKLIEEIKYPDINYFKEKYVLGNPSEPSNYIEADENKNNFCEWSDNLIEYTKNALLNLEFGCSLEGQVRMKRNDGSYGFIPLADALSNKYNVHHDEGGIIDEYSNVSDMIADGWVLD